MGNGYIFGQYGGTGGDGGGSGTTINEVKCEANVSADRKKLTFTIPESVDPYKIYGVEILGSLQETSSSASLIYRIESEIFTVLLQALLIGNETFSEEPQLLNLWVIPLGAGSINRGGHTYITGNGAPFWQEMPSGMSLYLVNDHTFRLEIQDVIETYDSVSVENPEFGQRTTVNIWYVQ